MMRLRLTTALMLLPLALPALAAEVPARIVGGVPLALGLPGSGRVTEVKVTPGQQVQPGQTLLCLDRAVARARLAAAEQTLRWLRGELDEAARELQRQQELYDQTLLAQHDLQLARIAHDRARARLARARLEAAAARRQLEARCLQAPVAGRIAGIGVVPGQEVLSADRLTTLLTLLRDDARLVQARLGAEQADALVEGSSVTLLHGKRRLTGRVTRLVPVGNGQWQARIEVSAGESLPDTGARLRLLLPTP